MPTYTFRPPRRRTSRSPKALGWAALLGGVAVMVFWFLYFTTTAALGHGDPRVEAFEASFLVADAVFGVLLFASGVSLLRGWVRGPFLLAAAASMSLYLGLLDLTFYGRAGLYFPPTASALVELAVNAACLTGGAAGLAWVWRSGRQI